MKKSNKFSLSNKLLSVILSITSSITLAYSHEGEDHSFTPGVNPFEYFSHGSELYGILIIGLWILIFWGIYTLSLMVIGRHIKIKK